MTVVLVLGSSGLVGSRVREPWRDHFEVLAPTHAELDVLDSGALASYVEQHAPEAVVNLAAWADVDGAEAQFGDRDGLAYRLNATHPGELARICAQQRAYLLHVSTDYVFDGTQVERGYTEADPTNPLCWYGDTKLTGERNVQDSAADWCIARIEMPFTAQQHRKPDFARLCLARLRGGEPFAGVTDQRITPVLLDDAAEALRQLIACRANGIVHVASADWTTPYEFARGIARRLELPEDGIRETRFDDFVTTRQARRPQHSWLDVTKARGLMDGVLRRIDEQLDAWAAQALATSELIR